MTPVSCKEQIDQEKNSVLDNNVGYQPFAQTHH